MATAAAAALVSVSNPAGPASRSEPAGNRLVPGRVQPRGARAPPPLVGARRARQPGAVHGASHGREHDHGVGSGLSSGGEENGRRQGAGQPSRLGSFDIEGPKAESAGGVQGGLLREPGRQREKTLLRSIHFVRAVNRLILPAPHADVIWHQIFALFRCCPLLHIIFFVVRKTALSMCTSSSPATAPKKT